MRRTALFIEESVDRGTKWAAFEPNSEPLWEQVRRDVGMFLHELLQQGAFQGARPRDAYFVSATAKRLRRMTAGEAWGISRSGSRR